MSILQKLSKRFLTAPPTAPAPAVEAQAIDRLRIAMGRVETRQCAERNDPALQNNEFSVFSQWGEDGIIQYLLRHVAVPSRTFVEFGVENYTEANTRFLLVNDDWSGLIIDGSEENIRSVQQSEIYWRHTLTTVQSFITRENINDLLRDNGFAGELGLLSVDIDGVDYWVWEAMDVVSPALVVTEYNARWGPTRAVTVPYDPAFVRQNAHYSRIYYGASLAALVGLGRRKGYAFVGTNSAGNNAFFVRRDLLPSTLRELTSAEGFTMCKFREARHPKGRLNILSPEAEFAILEPLPVVEVES